jgi:hypothetical protein
VKRSLGRPGDVDGLSRRLATISWLGKLKEPDDDEPIEYRIAYSLSEIEETCLELARRIQCVARSKATSIDEIETLLDEIREDLRHLAYHTRDSRIYADTFSS